MLKWKFSHQGQARITQHQIAIRKLAETPAAVPYRIRHKSRRAPALQLPPFEPRTISSLGSQSRSPLGLPHPAASKLACNQSLRRRAQPPGPLVSISTQKQYLSTPQSNTQILGSRFCATGDWSSKACQRTLTTSGLCRSAITNNLCREIQPFSNHI